jgi:hypothetical protein
MRQFSRIFAIDWQDVDGDILEGQLVNLDAQFWR